MATSQFTIYTSSDPFGPGPITGLSGSLITILDACLVNGYGTGQYTKISAGWTKPFPNVSGSIGCYKQASGSKFTLFVNDAGPISSGSAGKEAWVTGWESMNSLAPSGSIFTGSNSVGTGYGQFPIPLQSLIWGRVVWRKSTTADSTQRSWIIMADTSTMYLWIQTGDTANVYYHGGFGDLYSLKGSTDLWRCFIYGRSAENLAGSTQVNDFTDLLSFGGVRDQASSLTSNLPGHYIARNPGGTGGSQYCSKKGDTAFCSQSPVNTSPVAGAMSGILSGPNALDGITYMSPVWLLDPSVPALRGRLRGIYHICHPIANFSDGQLFGGSGDFAGKQFMVIKTGVSGNSMWGMEISNTVETN